MILTVNNNSVSAIFGDVPEPRKFIDSHNTNKYQRLRDSVDGSYLCEWVFLGPWDIGKCLSALPFVLRFYVENPLSSE